MTTEEIASLINIYFDNMAAMNAKGWLEVFAEDAVIHDPVGEPPRLAHKDSQQFFKILANFFEKIELSKDDIFFVKNGAAVKWTMQVVTKKGHSVTTEGISIFEMNDVDKIQKVSSYWDEAAMMTKLKG
ncbi:nuclear transport factor 2 family protein [Leptolyngbya sp. DQ-M1]|uniref:nuclear transport factor 2 family protein n=1 Tax=Leptolyngbya sp. DQ-M1 TaxID=2933920 RepID=UPI003298C034